LPQKRRSAPDPIDSVIHEGIEYSVVHFGKPRGLKQNGGYLAKLSADTGEELALIKVYHVKYKWWRAMEQDKQDVFISGLELDSAGRRLLVTNEQGARFAVDLDTDSVRGL
jgi:hypothetical protein